VFSSYTFRWNLNNKDQTQKYIYEACCGHSNNFIFLIALAVILCPICVIIPLLYEFISPETVSEELRLDGERDNFFHQPDNMATRAGKQMGHEARRLADLTKYTLDDIVAHSTDMTKGSKHKVDGIESARNTSKTFRRRGAATTSK